MRLDDPQFFDAMYTEFDCHRMVSGTKRECSARVKRREQTEQAYKHFCNVYPYAGTKEDALARVKEQWTVGMGPIAVWMLWTVIGAFVRKFVYWAWDKATA